MTPAFTAFVPGEGTQLKDLQASGLTLRAAGGGQWCASADQLLIRSVRMQGDAAVVNVAKLTLTGAQMTLAPAPADASFDLHGLTAKEVHLEGVEVALNAAAPPRGATADGWVLDAVGGLQGMVQVFVRDAAWVVDAEVTLPIANGRLDFDRVVVEHVGPNSSMGVARNGVYVDAPNMGRIDLFRFTAPQVPGANYEERSGTGARVSDRGSLDLQPFVQAMLGAAEPLGRMVARDFASMLDRTKMSGELRLGDGALGRGRQRLVLAGQAKGCNRISLSGAVLGQRLVALLPQLSASGAAFDLLGLAGTTGPVSATVELHVTGLDRPGARPAIEASVHSMTLKQVTCRRAPSAWPRR